MHLVPKDYILFLRLTNTQNAFDMVGVFLHPRWFERISRAPDTLSNFTHQPAAEKRPPLNDYLNVLDTFTNKSNRQFLRITKDQFLIRFLICLSKKLSKRKRNELQLIVEMLSPSRYIKYWAKTPLLKISRFIFTILMT